jgi:hypothetical protein
LWRRNVAGRIIHPFLQEKRRGTGESKSTPRACNVSYLGSACCHIRMQEGHLVGASR